MACRCIVTAAFLEWLGAPMSARMHRGMNLRPEPTYSRAEMLEHFGEEDELLVPMLYEYGMRLEAEEILRAHRRFRLLPYWDESELHAHAIFEDEAVSTLKKRIAERQARASAEGIET